MILAQGEIVISFGSWPVEVLRAICIVAGTVDLVLLIPVGTRQRRAVYRETLLFFLQGIVTVSVLFTEIGRIGHVLTWRLPFNVIYTVGLAWWLLHYLRLPMSYVKRQQTEADPAVPLFRRRVRRDRNEA